ncbi:DUF2782 domain-containing protein [Ectothiorhodospira shaposhnikovii]|uniref:DUF2782 domain-containing protein n=1 Tax=Ectothiorhodospira shaposhnikovii TaxID=1054 RepID=UPI00399EF5AB
MDAIFNFCEFGDLEPTSEEKKRLIEPAVTIIEREGKRIEEYRFHGELYMIRMTPACFSPCLTRAVSFILKPSSAAVFRPRPFFIRRP